MGRQLDLRKSSRCKKRKNDVDLRLSCQQLAQRFQELLRLRETVRLAERGRVIERAAKITLKLP